MTGAVVTRFAPSPTGILHIGNARTALFNWLFARHHKGRFVLRIEDTDRARSSAEAVEAIFDGLRWLGLDWDGAPIYQSALAQRHAAVAAQLLARGRAYHCYCSPEELEAMRAEARSAGRPVLYDGRWRDRDPALAPPGIAPVVRLKAPRDGETVVADQVQGDVTFRNRQLDDMVLLRADGSPTYMLSVVVDDHDMAVSHVIRGDDHLNNAARQSLIYQAMEWPVPRFAHIPLIHGADGKKFSKRHGALGLGAYRDKGYLPDAIFNHLLRLGWSHGDDEVFSRDQAVEWFDLANVGRGAARFDFDRLDNLNKHYLRLADDAGLVRASAEQLGKLTGEAPGEADLERLARAMPLLKDRAKTILELAENALFIVASRPLSLDQKAGRLLDQPARQRLAALATALAGLGDWQAATLEAAVRGLAADLDIKLGQLAQPLRAALTGRTASPGIFDVLVILGRAESLARIDDAVAGRMAGQAAD